MKLINTSVIIAALILGACNSESEVPELTEVINEIEIPSGELFEIDLSASSTKWKRDVIQKGTSKKIKLFGKMTEVKMGEVSFNTDGEVELTAGEISIEDNQLMGVKVVYNVSSLANSTDGHEGGFNVVDHPNSTFHLNSIEKTDSMYIGKGYIQIEGVEKPVTSTLNYSKDKEMHILIGELSINTLDFPLRTEDSAESIVKDVIDITYSLRFK